MKKWLSKESSKKGTALIEFAIVIPIFLGFLFNIAYAGLVLHDRHVLSEIVYEYVRYIVADANQNISIMPDASGGAGLAFDNADRTKEELQKKVNEQLLLYKVEKKNDAIEDIEITISPHEKDVQSTTEITASYIKVTVHDADINIRVKTKLDEEAVPAIASMMCPNELVVAKELRLELRINKTLTVRGTDQSSK